MTEQIDRHQIRAAFWLLMAISLPIIDPSAWYWWAPIGAGTALFAYLAVHHLMQAAAYFVGRGMIDAAVLQQEKRDRGLEP